MDKNNIKSKALTSIIWKLMERIGAQLVSLIVSIVLARLLDPSDFGVVSIVAIFFTFANILISGGLNSALIQKNNADREDYSTVLHISVILSFLIYLILFYSHRLSQKYTKKKFLFQLSELLALPFQLMR